jgi:hypothetical protein
MDRLVPIDLGIVEPADRPVELLTGSRGSAKPTSCYD